MNSVLSNVEMESLWYSSEWRVAGVFLLLLCSPVSFRHLLPYEGGFVREFFFRICCCLCYILENATIMDITLHNGG